MELNKGRDKNNRGNSKMNSKFRDYSSLLMPNHQPANLPQISRYELNITENLFYYGNVLLIFCTITFFLTIGTPIQWVGVSMMLVPVIFFGYFHLNEV